MVQKCKKGGVLKKWGLEEVMRKDIRCFSNKCNASFALFFMEKRRLAFRA